MKIAIFGGDKRMLFAARAFSDDGHEVMIAGFDDLHSLCEIRICSVDEAAALCDIAVLPVRPLDGEYLNAPFSIHPIRISDLLKKTGKKPVFTGCADMIAPYSLGTLYDYTADADFTVKNAELTAEAAVGILIDGYEGAICGSDILVTGYGRIGKILCGYLSAMGAKVTSAARNPADRLLIAGNGMYPLDYPAIDFSRYPIIINTVPALVIGKSAVDSMRPDVFIIDLASVPGGVDHNRAKERDLSCIHALSLPGKTAPLAAGTIIKDTILKQLSHA